MGAKIVGNVLKTHLQMVQERFFAAGNVIIRDGFIKDREVSGFLDVGDGAKEEPERIVIKTAADVVVAALGEGLVLMVAAAVRELSCGNVQDALTGPFRNLVHEANKVLV